MTHGYLMDDNSLGQRPVCEWCGAPLLTVHTKEDKGIDLEQLYEIVRGKNFALNCLS